MRLDKTLTNALLLVAEEWCNGSKSYMITHPGQHESLVGFSIEAINYHLKQLVDDGMLQGQLSEDGVWFRDITPRGRDYLNTLS